MNLLWLLSLLAVVRPAEACTAAPACSCVGPVAPVEALAGADAVFVGMVVAIRDTTVTFGDGSGGLGYQQRVVELQVEGAWKGVASNRVTVLTGRGGGDCGFPFRRAGKYLVYAHRSRGASPALTTSICSRTSPALHAAEDLRSLGPPPFTGTSSRP
ncbi:MAG TPA: hypothetical protein VFX98_14165 [Longimicrobiaceae bacterium]|nr:hypothetical protein [Longimicrobiaceae bacterium]